MHITKVQNSISQQNSLVGSFPKSSTISGRQKFENVEKLTTIVNELQNTSTPQGNNEVSGRVLETIREKIKNNYDKLYDEYEVNKKAILKNIHQTENNRASEDTLKAKFDQVIKEKNHFDKFKDQVETKQRKLKKMMNIRDQLKESNFNSDELVSILEDRAILIGHFEEYKKTLEYEAAILQNMKSQRRNMKIVLKERQQAMMKQEVSKKEKIKKLKDSNHNKKMILNRIQAKIQEEDTFQLPQSLTEQLQKRLQQYETKYTQQNILKHESILNKRKMEEEKQQRESEQKLNNKMKALKQIQQKQQFNKIFNNFMEKQTEEEKLRILCGVDDLSEISLNAFENDQESLKIIKQKIEEQSQLIQEKTDKITEEIKILLTSKESEGNGELLRKEKQLEEEKKQLRRLKAHMSKKHSLMIEWEAKMQQIVGNCNQSQMTAKLEKVLFEMENIPENESLEMMEFQVGRGKRKFSELMRSESEEEH